MDHTRHIGIYDASNLSVVLIGSGGIGAITALTLAKMGVRYLAVYDDDEVSEVNLPTQLHKVSELGSLKVYALRDMLHEFSDEIDLFPMPERVNPDTRFEATIVISAVDSIQARKDIWQAVDHSNVLWYMDARMGAEEFQLKVVDMSDPGSVVRYDQEIENEDDSRIPDAPCTMKATFYCASLASAMIGRTVRMIATGITPPYYYVQNLVSDFVFSARQS